VGPKKGSIPYARAGFGAALDIGSHGWHDSPAFGNATKLNPALE